MKKKDLIIPILGSATLLGMALVYRHIGSNNLYPNQRVSPGEVATQTYEVLISKTSCGTYSQCNRKTTDLIKSQVEKEYPNCPKNHEIDHLVPLALGGADDIKNLWCQPEENDWNGQNWGFHTKDRLETYLVAQMKSGKVTPKDAQNCILIDWVACYQKYLGKSPIIGFGDPDNN